MIAHQGLIYAHRRCIRLPFECMGNSFDISTFLGYMSILGQNIVREILHDFSSSRAASRMGACGRHAAMRCRPARWRAGVLVSGLPARPGPWLLSLPCLRACAGGAAGTNSQRKQTTRAVASSRRGGLTGLRGFRRRQPPFVLGTHFSRHEQA